MGLFSGNKHSSNLKSAKKMVEEAISSLKLVPEENRLQGQQEGYGWGVMKGSAEVFIFIIPGDSKKDTFHSFQVVSPVMKLPESSSSQVALYRRLLELNVEILSGVSFGMKGDTVMIVADRSTEDLNLSEVKSMILRVGYFADLYDDELVSQYGGHRYAE